MQYMPNLGELCGSDARRDAVHIAVAPLMAGQQLEPGDYFCLRESDSAALFVDPCDDRAIGYVDPVLKKSGVRKVLKGQRFWGHILPGTITGLRHIWSHPAFTTKLPEVTT